ncbi:MAG: caspase family protein, partial [Cyanobacteria bacterium J06573_11]
MNRYALIVGIDEYSASTPLGGYISPGRLRKARSDAEAIHALLKDHGNFNDILPLYDEAATHAELVKALKNVLLEQGPQSEVLIYYAGHGFTARPTEFERQGYLATYDCQLTGQGETLTEVKDGLSFATLNGVISQAREKGLAGLAVFLDCCESEFVIEQSLMNNRLSGLTQRGYFLSAACRSYEVARETGTYGVYTGALVAALEDRAAGEMTVSEAHNRVVRALKGSRQEPIAFGYGNSMVMVSYQRSLGKEAAVSDENPYQGLKAFQKETARFFFGREEETRRLWERLQRSNFVAVLGPSGSGKSSVVRAGLAKQLVDEGWQVLTMMPGGDPPGRLRAEVERFLAKSEVSVSAGGRRRLVGALEGDGLLAMAEAWAVELPGVRVLLLVDQFEEVFTQCAADKRDCFIRALVAVGQAKTPLAVVMTMRSDFYNEWLVTGQPSMLVSDYSVPLSPLRGENCENLKAAIVEPAGLQGYEIEAELLELLLEDVTAEENSLPLLEFALEALWEARDTEKRVLTVTAYRQMEKLTGALNRQAEKVYEQMREPERIWAKRICLQLVRIGRDGRDTRQRQPKETLLALA